MTSLNFASFLPYDPPPNEITWELVDNSQRSRSAFGYAAPQVVTYGTDFWRATIRYRELRDAQRASLEGFVARVGNWRPFFVMDWVNRPQGTFPTSELILQPDTAAYWQADSGRVITTDSSGIRVTKTSGSTSGIGTAAALTTVSGAIYALRGVVHNGGSELQTAECDIGVRGGSSAFSASAGGSGSFIHGGRRAAKLVAGGTSMYVGVADHLTEASNWPQPIYYTLRGMSCVRAFTVHGGSSSTPQFGNGLYVDGLTASEVGVLKTGDRLEFIAEDDSYTQMLRLTEDVCSDSSGRAFIQFAPALRGQALDDDLLVPYKCSAQMHVVDVVRVLTEPPAFRGSFEIVCEEL